MKGSPLLGRTEENKVCSSSTSTHKYFPVANATGFGVHRTIVKQYHWSQSQCPHTQFREDKCLIDKQELNSDVSPMEISGDACLRTYSSIAELTVTFQRQARLNTLCVQVLL